jgi:hypothetical protein
VFIVAQLGPPAIICQQIGSAAKNPLSYDIAFTDQRDAGVLLGVVRRHGQTSQTLHGDSESEDPVIGLAARARRPHCTGYFPALNASS